jgi:hypothetical protein
LLQFFPGWTIALHMLSKSLAVVAAFALCGVDAGAAEGWSVLRSGMNRSDTTHALGDPLLKNSARGFEVWLYDGGAEVLCFMGVVVAWTAPNGVNSPEGRQVDVRSFFKSEGHPSHLKSAAPGAEAVLDLPERRQMRLPKALTRVDGARAGR